jgi:F0F1-type ATP synthase membrane subunit c/vacuolar-type H+-ATPase subunit K
METARELFLKYQYPEAKDLCKQFLTLNVGVIVFSLSFADKVIEFSKTSEITRVVLLSSWSCLLGSLLGCGIALAYISMAAGQVVYRERRDFQSISVRTLVGVVISGALFVLGLIALAFASAKAVLA